MLTDVFSSSVRLKNDKTKCVVLTDEALSAAIEYLYRKTTEEFIHFCGQKAAKKLGTLADGILYSNSRILEEQSIKAVGQLEGVELKSFTGVGFRVPLMLKESPIALSIANHIHYNVCPHKGSETCYRISQQHAHIHQGRDLMKTISDDCVFCKKNRLKYLKQIMGPLDDTQLSISPIFM